MFGTRLFHLLLLALALACVSSALAPEVNNNALEARQDDDSDDDGATISIDLPTDAATSTEAIETSVTESAPVEEETSTEVVESTTPVETSTTEAESTTSTEETVEETSSTEVIPESTTSTTISQPTSEADPSTTESEDSVSSTTTEAATTSTEDSGDSEEEETSTTRAEPVTSTSFQTITRTNSAGELETTTSASVTTSDPELSEDDGGDSGGLPTNTRNIIIGVVVGVGGAIILGALGIVAWRIRARKKLAEENDGLMEYNGGYTPVDKSDGPAPGSSPSTAPTGSTRTPFQSTLENYHQPTQPVNASSNF